MSVGGQQANNMAAELESLGYIGCIGEVRGDGVRDDGVGEWESSEAECAPVIEPTGLGGILSRIRHLLVRAFY